MLSSQSSGLRVRLFFFINCSTTRWAKMAVMVILYIEGIIIIFASNLHYDVKKSESQRGKGLAPEVSLHARLPASSEPLLLEARNVGVT